MNDLAREGAMPLPLYTEVNRAYTVLHFGAGDNLVQVTVLARGRDTGKALQNLADRLAAGIEPLPRETPVTARSWGQLCMPETTLEKVAEGAAQAETDAAND